MAITSVFLKELDTLLAQHNLARSMSGNTVTIIDNDSAAQRLGMEGRWLGLEAQDYGAIFTMQGKRYKLVGVKSSRPKYPISAECCSTGRGYKFSRSVIQQIIEQRSNTPAPTPAANVPAPISPPSNTSNAHNPYADVAQF